MVRAQTIAALSCVLLTIVPACGGSAGEAAPARYSYANASSGTTSPENGYVVDGVSAVSLREEGGGEAPPQDIVLARSGSAGDGDFGGGDKTADTKPPPPPPADPIGKKDEAPAKEQAPPTGGLVGTVESSGAGVTGAGTKTAAAEGAITPMLVYTARVNMAVFEVRSSLSEVESLARSLGGFLARRNDQSITIRVPAARFDEAVKRIEKLGDMISRDVEVQDVTEEFHDTEIRLKNARAVRARLEELLSKATKVEESIAIEKELERVAEQIDRLEGRIKFLRDRAAYSTITVSFQPKSSMEIGRRPFNLPVPWIYELGLGRLLNL